MTTLSGPPGDGRTKLEGRRALRRATAADVAHAANVSRATVSYVLNAKPNHRIPQGTVERVRLAAEELGYTPSAAARALKLGHSDVVLGLLPDWPIGYRAGGLLQLLSRELDAVGLTFVAHPGIGSHQGWRPGQWRGVTPAAVIALGPLGEAEIKAITDDEIVLEMWFSGVGSPEAPAAGRPYGLAGRLQVEYLASTGHRRLGFAYIDDRRLKPFADARLAEAREACRALGLPPPVVERMPLDLGAATDAVRAWASSRPRVTAVCAYHDDLALALLAAADGLGVRVPDDLAVIGVEDIPAAAFAHPPLTTIASDPVQHARYVAASVLARLRGLPRPAPPEAADSRIVVRGSA